MFTREPSGSRDHDRKYIVADERQGEAVAERYETAPRAHGIDQECAEWVNERLVEFYND